MTMISKSFIRILMIAVALGSQLPFGTAHAQDQVPAVRPRPDQGTAAPSSAASNEMKIYVAVTDKVGHHIGGLGVGDFTLLDNKEPQKLIDVRPIDARDAAANPPHLVVVVDMINIGFSDVAWERQQLDSFLKQDGGKLGYPTSIATLTDTGAKMQRVPSLDGNALLAAFDKTQTELRSVNRSAGFYGAAEQLEMSLNQMAQLSAYEATQPGRKIVLMISPGWPLLPRAGDQEDMKQREWVFNTVVQFTNGLREAQITLYCLDPFDVGRGNPFYYQGYLKGVSQAKQALYPNLALQVLAEHTGGQVLINGKDITGDLNIGVRDASAGYELTFAPAPGDRPNEYHALQVQVDKPEVKIRTVSGYYARPQPEGGLKPAAKN
jgi:VWFA-related protein